MSHFLTHRLVDVPGSDGRVVCEVCNAGEAEMLSYCPGHELNVEALVACYDGNVIDLTYWLQEHHEPCDDYPPLSAFPVK